LASALRAASARLGTVMPSAAQYGLPGPLIESSDRTFVDEGAIDRCDRVVICL
jgi:hypothetical protein